MNEDIDWSQAYTPRSIKDEYRDLAKVQPDPHISHIVGRPIPGNDPRLIRLVVKWKKKTGNSEGTDRQDNFHRIPEFVKEVKETFNGEI